MAFSICGETHRRVRRNCCVSCALLMLLAPFLTSTGSAQTVPPRPLGADLPVFRPGELGAGEASPCEGSPTGSLSLREALALALMQSPELAVFSWELRAQDARILQAGRPPNPVVSALVEDLGAATRVTGAEGLVQPQTTIQLSQMIELGGKRVARQRLAERTRDLAAWDFEAVLIDVFTRVARTFIDVLASQQAVALSERTLRLVEEVRQTVGARVTAGVVSPIEQTKAEVALATVRIESDRAKRTLAADRTRLAALWGGAAARFESAAGDLTVLPAVPAFGALQDRLARNPELARWSTEIAQREAALEVERSKRVPDVTVSAGYRRFTDLDSNALLIGASVPLPLFDRNRGGIQEASARVSKAQAEQRAAQMRVTTALAEAYRALAGAQDEVATLGANVIPGAQSAFEAVSEGYRLGRFGYLDVLDAQRTLVSANAQYLRALAEFHKAVAEVERLIGAPLAVPAPATSPGLQ